MTAELKPYNNPDYSLAFEEWIANPLFLQWITAFRKEYEAAVFEEDSPNSAWRNTPQQASYFWESAIKIAPHQRLFCLEFFVQKLLLSDYYRYDHKTNFQQLQSGWVQLSHRIYLKPLFRIKPAMPADSPHYGNIFLECSAEPEGLFSIKITANYYAQDGHLSFERLMQLLLATPRL